MRKDVREPHSRISRVKPRKRILIAQTWWENRIFRGIAEYAKKQGWILDCRMQWNRQAVPSYWSGDGIIAFTAGNAVLEEFILGKNVPVVDLEDYHNRMPGVPKVIGNDRALGAMAAKHFLAQGFRHMIFVSQNGMRGPVTENRYAGFLQHAEKNNVSCRTMTLATLMGNLPDIPRPLGVFAAGDQLAIETIMLLKDQGVSVPFEVAVLGIDNSEIICECAEVPLSSIDCDFEKKGWLAAELLDQLMSGKAPPARVVVRASSDVIALPHAGAARVLQYLYTHCHEPLSLAQVCRRHGQSLRTIQDVFKKHAGRTLQEELIRLRLEKVESLMRENPEMKMDALALESGFGSRINLTRAFLKYRGMPPGKYCREKCQPTAS
ncbi:MAG: substrate-binding domain-containing protein [Puniceicoccales bacterium]|jgi:LacI family transcriptional regulator|nr:substrate-binding domain-containing protein [Puniceicoccales bacterium]